MSTVKISDKATVEFLQFLKDNEVTSDTVRIHFAGMGWGGPAFNLVLDEIYLFTSIENIFEYKTFDIV